LGVDRNRKARFRWLAAASQLLTVIARLLQLSLVTSSCMIVKVRFQL